VQNNSLFDPTDFFAMTFSTAAGTSAESQGSDKCEPKALGIFAVRDRAVLVTINAGYPANSHLSNTLEKKS
jgi:hypothetical protein